MKRIIIFLFLVILSYSYSFERNSDNINTHKGLFFLEQLDFTHIKQGWGKPQRNLSVTKKPIKINDKIYRRGIGTHAISEITILLDGNGDYFQSFIGINDEACNSASVIFSVWLDGVKKYSSGIITKQKQRENPPAKVFINLQGVKVLTLVVDDANNGNSCDHVTWAEPIIKLKNADYTPKTIPVLNYSVDFESELRKYNRQQYYPLLWKNIGNFIPFKNPPVLLENETFRFWNNVTYLDGWAVIPVIVNYNKSNQYNHLIIWNPETGRTQRIKIDRKQIIWTIASDTLNNHLLLGIGKKLIRFDLKNQRLVNEVDFFNNNASDISVLEKKLIVRYNNKFEIFDIDRLSLLKIIQLDIPSIQRMLFWKPNKVVLASTYWGNSLKILDINTGQLSPSIPVRMPYHYHSLLRMCLLTSGEVGFIDMTERRAFGMLKFVESSWILMDKNTQILSQDMGFRHSPVKYNIEARVSIEAKKDTPETESYIHLMPKENYHHILKNEKFITNSRILFDSLGNRYLIFKVPALTKGQKFEKIVYSARLTIYQVKLNIRTTRTGIDVPDELKIYLLDDPWYDLENPIIISKLKELTKNARTLDEIVTSIHNYSKTIPGAPRYDPAPVVIQVNGGGCNNHTRVQVALLRKAGIPARFAWNFWGFKSGVISGNHYICEAWLPDIGWIPMEGQGYTFDGTAGELNSNYLIESAGHVDTNNYIRTLKFERMLFTNADGSQTDQWKLMKINF